jgi:hypothetical protein
VLSDRDHDKDYYDGLIDVIDFAFDSLIGSFQITHASRPPGEEALNNAMPT